MSLVGTVWKSRTGTAKYVRVVAEYSRDVDVIACQPDGRAWTNPPTKLLMRKNALGGISRYERVEKEERRG